MTDRPWQRAREWLTKPLSLNVPFRPSSLFSGHKSSSKTPVSSEVPQEIYISGSQKSEVSSYVPDGLAWTEYDLELKAVQTLKNSGSGSPRVSRSPFPLELHSLLAIPGSSHKFLIFGGYMGLVEGKPAESNDTFLLSMEDMSLIQLETGGAIPKERVGHRAAIVGGTLIVFGGNISDEDNYLYLLHLDTKMWSKFRPPSPFPRTTQGHSMTAAGNAIWLFGGGLRWETGNPQLDFVCFDNLWCLKLGDSESGGRLRWREVPKQGPWPQARSYHTAIHHNGSLYIFGGACMNEDSKEVYYINELWKFNMQTETWTAIKCKGSIPPPRCSHSAAIINENMFIAGGLVNSGIAGTDEAFVFNITGHYWASLGMLGQPPLPSKDGTLWAAQSQLILLGGQSPDKPCLHVAETTQSSWHDSLSKIQFTTETTQLKFTSEVVDLSRFVRKQGDGAYALAGYSDVWRGEMTDTGQSIAIKVLRITSPSKLTPTEKTRFDRELSIWVECQHPRVLELLGYAYIEGIPCLISPWCENGNIMEYLKKNPTENRLQLVTQVAEGLVYLHGRDPPVIHSDMKPANVLINESGDAKICDFGISKLMMDTPSGFTTTKGANFTLRYSSKELLCGSKNSMTSDVFAFGMLVLEVITNKPPFFKILLEAMVVIAIINGETPSPEDYPELPAADRLWDIMKECWDAEPTKRPTMVEVLDKFRECARTEQP